MHHRGADHVLGHEHRQVDARERREPLAVDGHHVEATGGQQPQLATRLVGAAGDELDEGPERHGDGQLAHPGMLGQHGLVPRQQLGDTAAFHHDRCGKRAAEHLGVVAACLGAQRRRLGTEPLGLGQVAAEQGLHAVEERDVPPVERRPELFGNRREPLDLLVHLGRPELEQRHHPEAPRRQGHLPVPGRLREGEHLRRGAQPGLGVRRPRLHVAPGAQRMGQSGPIAGLPGEPHGLIAPLLPVCRRGEVGRRDRTPREQARAQLGVVGAEQGQRLLEQAELAVVPEPHLEAAGIGPNAQRGQGQEVGAAEVASEVGGPQEGVACGLPITAEQVRVAQTEEQVRLLLGLGTRGDGPLELLGRPPRRRAPPSRAGPRAPRPGPRAWPHGRPQRSTRGARWQPSARPVRRDGRSGRRPPGRGGPRVAGSRAAR